MERFHGCLSDKGFGFIAGDDGQEYFVHRSAIRGQVFEQLREGQPVTFDGGRGDKGITGRERAARMKNLRIYASLEDGSQVELARPEHTGREVIESVFRQGQSARPTAMVIEALSPEGGVVRVVIPSDESELAKVFAG